MNAGIVKSGLGVDERRSIVGAEHHQCTISETLSLKSIQYKSHSSISPIDRLVVLHKLCSRLRQIRNPVRYLHVLRSYVGQGDTVPILFSDIAKFSPRLDVSMWIDVAHSQEERLI